MTEKRLYDVIDKAEPRGQSVTYEGIPCTARTCVTQLNKLTEENEQLKSILTELADMIQSDVKRGVKTYPKTLLDYLSNAMKVLQE